MNNQPNENMKKSHLNQSSSVQTRSNTGDLVELSEAKVRNNDDDQDTDTTSTSEIEEQKDDDDNMMDVNDNL